MHRRSVCHAARSFESVSHSCFTALARQSSLWLYERKTRIRLHYISSQQQKTNIHHNHSLQSPKRQTRAPHCAIRLPFQEHTTHSTLRCEPKHTNIIQTQCTLSKYINHAFLSQRELITTSFPATQALHEATSPPTNKTSNKHASTAHSFLRRKRKDKQHASRRLQQQHISLPTRGHHGFHSGHPNMGLCLRHHVVCVHDGPGYHAHRRSGTKAHHCLLGATGATHSVGREEDRGAGEEGGLVGDEIDRHNCGF